MPYIRWIFAALHLLALGIGLGAIWWRARSLRGELNQPGLRRVFYADNLWLLAAVLWILTGLVRAFAGLEKGSAYYLTSTAFWIKMSLLAVVLLMEVWPAVTLIRWRIRLRRGETIQNESHLASRLAAVSTIQAIIIVLMIFTATAMARGLGT